MRRILLSLGTILLVMGLVAGATWAIFSSAATVDDNTFATGTLEIRVNGQPTRAGFSVENAAPGTCYDGEFNINNYGAPWFAGPSTLNAEELVVSAAEESGDSDLYNALTIVVEANRGWPTWMPVYTGDLSSLSEANLLDPRWTNLIPGSSEDVRYSVCLPIEAGDELQGMSSTFDFVIDAYNPERP